MNARANIKAFLAARGETSCRNTEVIFQINDAKLTVQDLEEILAAPAMSGGCPRGESDNCCCNPDECVKPPAMLNGVEGLAGVRDKLIVAANNPSSHGRELGLRKIMLEQAKNITAFLRNQTPRAADNRDAAACSHVNTVLGTDGVRYCNVCGNRDAAGVDDSWRQAGLQRPSWYMRREQHACEMGYVGLAEALDDLETRRNTPTAAPAGEAVAWTTTKPTIPGAYWVKGYAYGRPTEKALVEVKVVGGELCSNLHAVNSDNDTDDFAALARHYDKFEWLGPLTTHPPAAEVREVAFTTGHCENNKKKGGCPMHNLQCGWPECDRRAALSPPGRAEGGCREDCSHRERRHGHDSHGRRTASGCACV